MTEIGKDKFSLKSIALDTGGTMTDSFIIDEKGAFSGAPSKKIGKFEFASNGTIFLDEIGDMSLMTQAKILRVLQEQKIQRLGGSRTISINVRVIAASNKNLEQEIEQGHFREDLYYRLNVIPIEVPPLRQRIEDIPELVETFLEEFANQNRSNRKAITRYGIWCVISLIDLSTSACSQDNRFCFKDEHVPCIHIESYRTDHFIILSY